METIKWNSEEEKQVIELDKKSKRIERSKKRRSKRLSKDELFEQKWK
jgi:hypothetical protein